MRDLPRVITNALDRRPDHGTEATWIPRKIAPHITIRIICTAGLLLLTFCRYYVGFDSHQPFPRGIETYSIARNLAEEGTFANPFAPLRTGPSAHLAPVLPFMMALVMRLFGYGPLGWYVWSLVGAIVVAALVSTFPFVAERSSMPFITGVVAGILWLIAKPAVAFGWEGHWVALIVAIEILLIGGGGKHISLRLVLVGVICGIGLLLSPPATIPMFACGVLLVAKWSPRTHLLRRIFLIAIIPSFIVTPWLVRNYLVFHTLIPVRDNFGLELAVSFNDCAVFGLRLGEEVGCAQRQHPNVNIKQAEQVLQMGEANYSRLRLGQAIGWISAHPRRSLILFAERVYAFWFPSDTGRPLNEILRPGSRVSHAVIYTLTLLSLLGITQLALRDRFSASVFGIWLVIYPAVYYLIQYIYRYRMPTLWMSFLLGSLPSTWLLGKLSRSALYGERDDKSEGGQPGGGLAAENVGA